MTRILFILLNGRFHVRRNKRKPWYLSFIITNYINSLWDIKASSKKSTVNSYTISGSDKGLRWKLLVQIDIPV